MKFTLFGFLIAMAVTSLFAQSEIPCDIVELAKFTLKENPTIKKGINDISMAEAGIQIQKSAFDYNLFSEITYNNLKKNTLNNDNINSLIDGNYLLTRNTDYSLGLQKKFRSGLNANLSAGYSLNSRNINVNSFNEKSMPFTGEHASSATLSLTQPLLKGRGKKVTTTAENIAKKNSQNAQDEYRFSISYEILQLSVAYWQYLTAYRSLEIYKENEKRVRNILEVTNELVNADKKPEGDLLQIYAELANQERQTKVAEQYLFESKIYLGSVIGLSTQRSLELNEPVNEFPNILESGLKKGMTEATFMELAISNRMDLKARQKAEEALELQKYSAKKNLKPQLDLTGFVSYGGQSIGNGFDNTVSTFASNEGRSMGGGFNLSFKLPVNNNSAKGNYIQIESSLINQHIINDNLERNIHLNVFSALSNLENSAIVLNKAEESLTHYRKAFKNEETKFQNGLTTLLNLLIFQERLTYAELEYLQTHRQFATAIIKLRYETGTLIKEDETGKISIDHKTFYTIPVQN